jgi:hypothetical protein
VLFKFNTEALMRGAMKSGTEPFHHSFGKHLMLGEEGKFLGVKKVGCAGHLE